jgi:DnaK suppressor protein
MAKSIAKAKQANTVVQAKSSVASSSSSAKTVNNIQHYRELLDEKSVEIKRSMSTPAAAEIVARREEPNDYVDLADKSHEEWIFLNRNTQNASLLRQVEEALDRMNEGTYGVCDECGQVISPKRLEAVPWASYCISCQEKRGSWTN